MKVIFTKQAENDLEQIADFIAQDNPMRAFTFVCELEQKSLSIGETPKAFPIVNDLIDMGIRRRIYQNYSIFFYVDADIVSILRILNSSMDYSVIFAV